jgi:hypothetical protein
VRGKDLHRDEERDNHDEEDKRVGRCHLQPHGGVAVGEANGSVLVRGCAASR